MGHPSWSVLTYERLKDGPRQQSITCQVCGESFKVVTAWHLRTHGLTPDQYRRRFAVQELRCEEHLYRRALRRLSYTKEEVIAFLRHRLASGESLAAMDVRAEQRAYFNAARSLFRYWHDTLLAAGIDPMTVKGHVPFRYWSRQRVHDAIRHRIAEGKSMRLDDVLSESRSLYGAAYRYAGGWRRALRDLGYDYRQFCTERPKWSAKRVIRRILEREASGLPLSATDVGQEDSTLFSAAGRYFGNWGEALRVAGIDPEIVSRIRAWTPASVVRQICELGSQGAPLSCKATQRADPGLIAAAYAIYGSWDNALQAAGYDPATVRCRLPAWTRSTIIRAIQDRVAAGLSVRVSRIRPHSAVVAAYRLFGSWDAALEAASASHLVTKQSHWSQQAVVIAIRRRHEEGRLLSAVAVRRDDKALTTAARRYFGDWALALRAAGFDPDQVRLHRPKWTVDVILETIRKRAAAGAPLGSHTCEPASMVNAARRLCGSWPKALEAAGVHVTTAPSVRNVRMEKRVGGRPKHHGR